MAASVVKVLTAVAVLLYMPQVSFVPTDTVVTSARQDTHSHASTTHLV